MQAATHDLPLRGNYFSESEYLEQNLAAGTIRNRAGARMLAVTDECLVAVHNVIGVAFGENSAAVLKSLGRDWGGRAAEQFVAEMGRHHERSAADLPLAVFAADLTAAFLHHGWGRLRFDLSRYSHGILAVEVHSPVLGSTVKRGDRAVEVVMEGFLSGMFSQLSGTELDCLQTECRASGGANSRFLLTVPERLAGVAWLVDRGDTHDAVVAELENTRV